MCYSFNVLLFNVLLFANVLFCIFVFILINEFSVVCLVMGFAILVSFGHVDYVVVLNELGNFSPFV